MNPRNPRSIRRPLLFGTLWLTIALAASSAQADGLYSITGLGTLPGQSSSVATSINNSGQVVGISYSSSDGYFASGLTGPDAPPRFESTGNGARSFLYTGGLLTQINPTGGLAMSINSSRQVVGGPYSSINDSGQYVGGAASGTNGFDSTPNQLVSGGTAAVLQMAPFAINNSGEIARSIAINEHGGNDSHPAINQNGQITDLFSKVGSGEYVASSAVAINRNGDLLITVSQVGAQTQSYLYHANTGEVTNLTTLPGGSSMIGAALNSTDHVVGNGFLYSGGSIQSLLSLLPAGNGWSNLNATGINDSGQIVGQGNFNGQLEAFEMTPNAQQVPEPATLAVWCLASLCVGSKLLASRASRAKSALTRV